MKTLINCILFLLLVAAANAQVKTEAVDSAGISQEQKMPSSVRLLSPTKATMMAAAFPGLGQVYNRKYWKIPLVYAGFGALGYSIIYNSRNFNESLTAYQHLTDGIPETMDYVELVRGVYEAEEIDPALEDEVYNPQAHSTVKDFLLNRITGYRRYRDLSYIGVGLWYIISILDANVDAVLSDYDISPDLSLSIEPVPVATAYGNTMGVGLTVTF